MDVALDSNVALPLPLRKASGFPWQARSFEGYASAA